MLKRLMVAAWVSTLFAIVVAVGLMAGAGAYLLVSILIRAGYGNWLSAMGVLWLIVFAIALFLGDD